MMATDGAPQQSNTQRSNNLLPDANIPLPAIRNHRADKVLHHGFVECPAIIDGSLCGHLADMPLDGASIISNAVQKDVTGSLCADVVEALQASTPLRDAVRVVFDAAAFEVCTVLVLNSEPFAPPQIPHADDHRIRELFGVVQLRAGQCPTEGLPYNADAIYPTDIAARCALCRKQCLLPDGFARRREHLREQWTWTCGKAGRRCSAKRSKTSYSTFTSNGAQCDSDDEQLLAEFDEAVLRTFRELLNCPEKVTGDMRSLGIPNPAVGDGIVGLPTLIHRGPGSGAQERRVLFFSIRPLYSDLVAATAEGNESVADNDEHDYSEQVHAGWLLARVHDAAAKARIYDAYAHLGYTLEEFD